MNPDSLEKLFTTLNEAGFRKVIQWYLENESWTVRILSRDYKFDKLGKA